MNLGQSVILTVFVGLGVIMVSVLVGDWLVHLLETPRYRIERDGKSMMTEKLQDGDILNL